MSASGWQPTSKAPRDGTVVVLRDRWGHEFLGYWRGRWRTFEGLKAVGVAEFMPYPKPQDDEAA